MGSLRSRLAAWLLQGDRTPVAVERSHEDSRQHERFAIMLPEAARIVTEQGEALPILNLSYGGFAAGVSQTDDAAMDAEPCGENARLCFLDQSIEARFKRVHKHAGILGCSFEHKDARTLVFLREILEHLRFGSSLHEIRKDFLKEQYRSDDWLCLRGEGPTDLTLQHGSAGELVSFLCTMRNGEAYYELRLKDGHYTTGMSIDKAGTASRMLSSAEIDKDTLRLVMQILLGIREARLAREVMPVLTFGLARLTAKV